MLPLFKPKPLLTNEENARVVAAIRASERTTSGEIRVFIETKNPLVNPLERAATIFYRLKMEETDHRNAVLIYIAMKHHELAIFGDEGIHAAVGSTFWQKEVDMMIAQFQEHHMVEALVKSIEDIGRVLTEKFPYIPTEDKNELPDEIVFGH